MNKSVEIVVDEKVHELFAKLKGFVEIAEKQLSDGFQAGEDVPALVLGAYQNLLPAVAGAKDAVAQFGENTFPALRGATVGAVDVVEVIAGKKQ